MVLEQLGAVAGLEGASRLVFALLKARNTWHVDLPAPFQVLRSILVRVDVSQEAHGNHIHVFASRTSEVFRLDRMLDQLVNLGSDSSC